jgi:quercetin dioxygenase-like cupin family protein
MQTINMGSVQLRFLQDKDGTEGSLDLFELTLQPNAHMPIPHYHETWDETVYGLVGVSTWTVDGRNVEVGPGQSVFIRRGAVHGFTNSTDAPVTCLCILSPGVLGRSYFEEIAGLLAAGSPDPAKMKEVMLRHRLIPVPPVAASGAAPS